MGHSNGASFANGSAMGINGNSSYGGTDGSRPPSWWFTFPADPRWQM